MFYDDMSTTLYWRTEQVLLSLKLPCTSNAGWAAGGRQTHDYIILAFLSMFEQLLLHIWVPLDVISSLSHWT